MKGDKEKKQQKVKNKMEWPHYTQQHTEEILDFFSIDKEVNFNSFSGHKEFVEQMTLKGYDTSKLIWPSYTYVYWKEIEKIILKQQSLYKITSLSELELYLSGISTGVKLKLGKEDIWFAPSGSNPRLIARDTETAGRLQTFEEVGNGNFYWKGENNRYLTLFLLSDFYVNQNSSSTSDELEVWLYKGEILVLGKSNDDPINRYYDMIKPSANQFVSGEVRDTSFPTQIELDNWVFKISI